MNDLADEKFMGYPDIQPLSPKELHEGSNGVRSPMTVDEAKKGLADVEESNKRRGEAIGNAIKQLQENMKFQFIAKFDGLAWVDGKFQPVVNITIELK